MRAKKVYEAVDFQRGQDPKEAMGIGNAEFQLINKLDRLAKKYGFQKVPLDKRDEQDGVINIQKWFNSENECQIILYIDEGWDEGYYWINYEDLVSSGNDGVEIWLDPENWEYHYGGKDQ
jgi:hypothetical protein